MYPAIAQLLHKAFLSILACYHKRYFIYTFKISPIGNSCFVAYVTLCKNK